jgi:hypothetical protein
MTHSINIEEARRRALDHLLAEVARTGGTFTVVPAQGEATGHPSGASLEPLRRLPGYVPAGWKDALYGE